MDGTPGLRPADQGQPLRNREAHDALGHRKVPVQRHDPRHRPGDGQAADQGLRRTDAGCAVFRAGKADGRAGHRPQARKDDHGELCRAGTAARGDGLSAELRRDAKPRGEDLQAVRRERAAGHPPEPLPAGGGHRGRGLQDGGQDRRVTGHWDGQRVPAQRRRAAHAGGGDERLRPLLPAARGALSVRAAAAGQRAGAD